MVSSKKKVLSAFLSLAMIGSMVAAVPLTASAAETTTTATPVVTYSVHQQTYGWESTVTGPATAGVTGQSKRLEALKINAPSGATITYSVHQQTYGWEAAVTNGKQAGVTGQSKRLEAVKISLSGLPGYTIQYRVHQQTYGWENWVSNGATAGVTGQSKRLEAIEIKLVPTIATFTAVNGTIGVGGSTTFTFKNADGTAYTPKTVTYSLADASFGSIDSTGKFTAGKAGKAVVNAVADGVALSATVNVYGAAAGITLSTPAALAADGTSKTTVTANIVDANGVTVANSGASFTVSASAGGLDANNSYVPYILLASGAKLEGGTVSGSTETFTATNGVATLTIVAPTAVPATSDTVVAYFTDANNQTHTASTTVSYTSSTAAALKLNTSATKIAAGGFLTIPVQVVNAAGVALTSGIYTVTATITGNAYLPGNVQTQQFSFNAATGGSITVYTPSYATGTVTVALSASGLTAATGSYTVGTAGTATQIALTTNDVANYVGGVLTADTAASSGSSLNLTATVEDASGLTATSNTAAYTYTIALSGTTVASGNGNFSSGVATIPLSTAMTTAGTYVVTVASSGLTSGTYNVTVKPGAVSTVSATPSVATTVAYASPTTTVTYTLVDAHANTVASSGTAVHMYLDATSTSGTLLNGSSAYTSYANALVINTNANGQVSATLTLPAAVGSTAKVQATIASTNINLIPTATVREVGTPVVNVTATPGQTAAYPAGAAAGVVGTPLVTIKAVDNYGSLANGDVLAITVPSGLFGSADISAHIFDGSAGTTAATISPATSDDLTYDVVADGNPILIYGATPVTAGTYTVKVVDISSPSQPSATATINVASSTVAGFDIFDANGTDLSTSSSGDTLAYGANMALTVKPVDSQHNPVATDAAYTVALPVLSGANDVSWRTSLSSGSVASVTFAAGQTSAAVYLVNQTAAAGSLTINDAAKSGTNIDAAIANSAISTVAPAFSTNGNTTLALGGTNCTVTGTAPAFATAVIASAASTTYTFTVTAKDSSGNALVNQAIYLSTPATGALNASMLYTNGNGQASFTFTTPSAWVADSTATFTVQIGGGTASASTANQAITVNVAQHS